jgi:amino acid adenylation domain-containing protein
MQSDSDHSHVLAPMQAVMLFEGVRDESPQGARATGYNVVQVQLEVAERLEAGPFQSAWNLAAERHVALRSRFAWNDTGMPRWFAACEGSVPLAIIDWTALSEGEQQLQRASFLRADRRRGFDLRDGPLLRVTVFRLSPERSEVVWSFHHILLDGRSFARVLREVFEDYDTLRSGAAPAARPVGLSFDRYLAWLAGARAADGHAHFRALLGSVAAPTALPGLGALTSDPSVGAGASYGRLSRALSPQQRSALAGLASRTGVGVSAIVHAAWALVVSRFTRESCVLFGTTRSLRRAVDCGDAEQAVGLFVNTLPLLVKLEDEGTVLALLGSVRAQLRGLRPYLHAQLAEVRAQAALHGAAPLFETLVTIDPEGLCAQLRATGQPRFRGARVAVHEQPSTPLNVALTIDPGILSIQFDRRSFSDTSVLRLIDALLHVLDQFAADAQGALSSIDVLPEPERARVLLEWNATAALFSEEQQIQTLVEARVDAQPDACALEHGDTKITYRELEVRANRLAHALRARGMASGSFVGVCCDRGVELVVALLAVLKAGAAYVPLEPSYPRERVTAMLRDARCALVVTQRRHRELFDGSVLALDDASELAGSPHTRPERLGTSQAPCYAIFTSGSTGTPNAVLLAHAAVVNTLEWVNRTFEVAPGDRLLFVTSPCFDLSVYDVFGVLAAGATVVIASAHELAEPQRLAEILVRKRITIWDSAPAMLQLVTTLPAQEGDRSSLRLVLLSGDWIPVTLPEQVRSQFPRARVVALGGATEAAIWSNWFAVEQVDPRWTSIPYGRPIQNARYHVLDERMRPVPVGVRGDLYIGGACLAQGYLNRPELTRQRFVPDPFRPGERLYRTGDLARYFEDGNLEFLGRTDSQVKIRGFRVELGEVESALQAQPNVRQSVCAAPVDASGHRALVAYVVPEVEPFAIEELKRALRRRLPDFMLPSQVVLLDALPLSSNGKVDRKALPIPGSVVVQKQRLSPRDALEREMVELWQGLLERPSIGVTDDFFELGGHSILALMLVVQANARFGAEISLARFLECPTVEEMARQTSARLREGARPKRMEVAGEVPLLLVGAGSYALLYREFPKLFPPERQPHVLHAAREEERASDMEALVAVYEREIRTRYAPGLLSLGGFARGCPIAHRLAHRLIRLGYRVPLLVFVDPRVHAPDAGHQGRGPFGSLGWMAALRRKASSKLFPDAGVRAGAAPLDDCELLLVQAAEDAPLAGVEERAWTTLVSGDVTQLEVAGPHMAFLGNADGARVAGAIAAALERASAFDA